MTAHRIQSKCVGCGIITEADYHKPAPGVHANVCTNCLTLAVAVLDHMGPAVEGTKMPDKEEVSTCFAVASVHLDACLKLAQQHAERLHSVAYYQS